MKNIGDGYWNYNGCDVYLAEHPKLQGKYEIYKGCDFISRAYNLKEAKKIIIEKFGKMSGGKRLKNFFEDTPLWQILAIALVIIILLPLITLMH